MSSSAIASGKTRKKRKPKHGRAQQVGATDSETELQSPSPASLASPDKQQAQSRFMDALDHMQRNTEDSEFIKLDNCNIFDAKTKKLAKALAQNRKLVTLDLSNNHIGAAGVQALAESLKQGGAPELVLLDLRNNDLSPESQSLMEEVQSTRKQLAIVVKSPEVSEEPEPRQDDGKESETSDQNSIVPATENMSSQQSQFHSFFQRLFQVGPGARLFGGMGMPNGTVAEEPDASAEDAFRQICSEVEKKDDNVHALSRALHTCVLGIRREMETCSVPFLSNTKLDELRPFTKECVLHLEQLKKVLDIPVPSWRTTFSRDQDVAAVGSHVALVAQLVERLSYARAGVISIHLVKSAIVPRLLALGFQYPTCSAIQATSCQMLRWLIDTKLRLLWEPLLKPNLSLQPEHVTESVQTSSLVALIHCILKKAAAADSMTKRPYETGFALNLAVQFVEASEHVDSLRSSLQACSDWESLVAPGSVLHDLRTEQSGELCGPKPSKDSAPPIMLDAAESGEVGEALPIKAQGDGAQMDGLLQQAASSEGSEGQTEQ